MAKQSTGRRPPEPPMKCTVTCDGYEYPSPEFWAHARGALTRYNTIAMGIALDRMQLTGETRRAVVEGLNGVVPWARERQPLPACAPEPGV